MKCLTKLEVYYDTGRDQWIARVAGPANELFSPGASRITAICGLMCVLEDEYGDGWPVNEEASHEDH